MSKPIQVVWFKRDLRIHDQKPLWEASKRGPCVCLYVFEPIVLNAEETDGRHFQFILDSLRDLRQSLREIGGELTTCHGTILDVFNRLQNEHSIEAIWSHEETGLKATYDRDLDVHDWCRANRVSLHEIPQFGVIRRLKNRDGWSQSWQRFMTEPVADTPKKIECIPAKIGVKRLPSLNQLGFAKQEGMSFQKGGERAATHCLTEFLETRGQNYRHEMSSPVTAGVSCSRLSPYLAYGNLSMKQAYQQTQQRKRQLRSESADSEHKKNWLDSLTAFEGRLSWHCHFIQKMEDEPTIEFQNMNRAYDGLREDAFNENYFDRWCAGETGYPMVDACMKALHQTGWINFRMRAMLTSFATYHLWLHWKRPAIYLAQQFLDFEPGIHYSQIQMQAGVTGINSVRIYSPIKQVHDQDPTGEFIRRFLPELNEVPDDYLAEPHRMPRSIQASSNCVIGVDYPSPIVDHKTAYNQAKKLMFARKSQSATRTQSRSVFLKHGSRKRGNWGSRR